MNAWSGDDFDQRATHVVKYNDEGEIIGVVRIIGGESWTIDDYFDFTYDKSNGVEFGRAGNFKTFAQGPAGVG